MGFQDELDIKTADDIIKEQLGSDPVKEETEKDEAAEKIAETPEETAEQDDLKDVSKPEMHETEDTEETESEKMPENTKKKKKKGLFQVPVLISLFIVLGALLGYFIFVSFFMHTPQGLWTIQDDDGNTYYYEFDDDGTCVMTIGTIDNIGAYYQTYTETGDAVLYINQYYGMLAGNYTYSIKGSRLLCNQVMSLDYNGYTYELTQIKNKEELLTKPEGFIPNEELLGEWEYVIPEYGVSYTFTFNDDGTMIYNQADTIIYNAVYTVDDEYVHMVFFTDSEQTVDLPYSFEGDTLNLMELECHRVGAPATNDQV